MVQKVTDADYLKSADLGQVIAKGMATLYETNPKNPVDFLAKWLLNYSKVEQIASDRIEELVAVQQNIEAFAQLRAEQQAKDAEREAEEAKVN